MERRLVKTSQRFCSGKWSIIAHVFWDVHYLCAHKKKNFFAKRFAIIICSSEQNFLNTKMLSNDSALHDMLAEKTYLNRKRRLEVLFARIFMHSNEN